MKATDLIAILTQAVADHGEEILVGVEMHGYGHCPVQTAVAQKAIGLEETCWESRDYRDLDTIFVAIH